MLALRHLLTFGMTTRSPMNIPVKPRILIADDSRIVRATLIKHIEGMFDFREAPDGELAWETLLIDPSIRVVITDLTMPKLDGYGLLQRIRASKITRIREIPVVVVSGSDEREERERARAAGASDLITKGIDTAQLLSRLDILSRLVGTQREFEAGLEALVKAPDAGAALPSFSLLASRADAALESAIRNKKNFVVLNVCVGLRLAGEGGVASLPPAGVLDAVGQLLKRIVRQTDQVARSGDAEFTLSTGNINSEAARSFGQRVCGAIANAELVRDEQMSFVASCGISSLEELAVERENVKLAALQELAHRRAMLGFGRGLTGVVGMEEEKAFLQGDIPVAGDAHAPDEADSSMEAPELATMLHWIKQGRHDKVLPHIGRISADLKPLLDLMMQQRKH